MDGHLNPIFLARFGNYPNCQVHVFSVIANPERIFQYMLLPALGLCIILVISVTNFFASFRLPAAVLPSIFTKGNPARIVKEFIASGWRELSRPLLPTPLKPSMPATK